MTPLATPTNQDPSVLKNFESFLVAKKYSSSTIRNYLSDIGNYFEFVKTLPLTPSLDRAGAKKAPLSRGAVERSETEGFRPEIVSSYLKSISSDPNYRRYLSSLSKFFQYALDQGLVKTNPLKAALRDKKPGLDEILTNYQEFLSKKKSESTIRNYLNDIRQFIDWSSKSPDSSAIAESSAPFEERGPKPIKSKLFFSLPFFKGRNPKGEGFENQ